MKVLVTGGAGFLGRWVVRQFLRDGQEVWVIDNLCNGRESNLAEFATAAGMRGMVVGDILNRDILKGLFTNRFDLCFHLAASINVQHSLDAPSEHLETNIMGTFNLLAEARRTGTKVIFVSTCMVYDRAVGSRGISEEHPLKPASPYAASKLAGEYLTLSYYHAYGLPVVVLRPFNVYGPFQRSTGEGGVIATFIRRKLEGKPLSIFGDGTQTRDFLYVEDCADFIVGAACSPQAVGHLINAGSGRDITINELAGRIAGNAVAITHVPHIHPQSEIPKLRCDYGKARALLGWEPKVGLEEGLARTERWVRRELKEGA